MLRHVPTSLGYTQRVLHSSQCVLHASSSRLLSTESASPKKPAANGFQKRFPRTKGDESFNPHSGNKSGPHPFVAMRFAERREQSDPLHRRDPYILNGALRRLCSMGKVNQAVNMLQNSPLDVQTAPNWNVLLSSLMSEHKYKAAYALYIEMKRRGIKPTLRTYGTMLGGWAKIDNWDMYSKQLDYVHETHRNFMEAAEAMLEEDPSNKDASIIPTNNYIAILGRAHLYQELFDTYNALPSQGPLAPDKFTFNIILQALMHRKELASDEEGDVGSRNASDAKLIWKQMLRIAQQSPSFNIDDTLLSTYVTVLMGGKPTDHLQAFDVLRDYFGLAKPGEPCEPAKIPPTSRVLFAALLLCNATRKFSLAIHWTRRFMENPIPAYNSSNSVPNAHHVAQMLKAYANMAVMGSMNESEKALEVLQWTLQEAALGREELSPLAGSYYAVIVACFRGADWVSATKTFELMTGYDASHFADGSEVAQPVIERRSRKLHNPDVGFLACMARTAFATGSPAHMRQCLRILSQYSTEYLFEGKSPSTKQHWSYRPFYAVKMASVIVDMMKVVERDKLSQDFKEEMGRWYALKERSKQLLRERRTTEQAVPPLEEEILGSSYSLSRTDKLVDYQMTARRSTTKK